MYDKFCVYWLTLEFRIHQLKFLFWGGWLKACRITHISLANNICLILFFVKNELLDSCPPQPWAWVTQSQWVVKNYGQLLFGNHFQKYAIRYLSPKGLGYRVKVVLISNLDKNWVILSRLVKKCGSVFFSTKPVTNTGKVFLSI